jgi:hypothetical protein
MLTLCQLIINSHFLLIPLQLLRRTCSHHIKASRRCTHLSSCTGSSTFTSLDSNTDGGSSLWGGNIRGGGRPGIPGGGPPMPIGGPRPIPWRSPQSSTHPPLRSATGGQSPPGPGKHPHSPSMGGMACGIECGIGSGTSLSPHSPLWAFSHSGGGPLLVNATHHELCKICGFHGGDYKEWRLLGFYAMWLL